ncbi:hypothetical protein BGZ60DRAFT_432733 [Tricladium varicosporioides]|nr:hypothetical protein BGZ60DRAFT_432733 [Hymenoscyphus varicosporioides]
MLKNKSKAFAPKFKAARRPGANNPSSAQSSARPSVEPQSQTPAPESATKETITLASGESPTPRRSKEFPAVVQHTPNPSNLPAPRIEQNTRTQEAAADSSTPNLKRKTREGGIPEAEPAAKRVSFLAPEEVTPAVRSNLLPSPITSTQKRKSRDGILESATRGMATAPVTEDIEINRSASVNTESPSNTNTNASNTLPSHPGDPIGPKPTNSPSKDKTSTEASTQQPLLKTNAIPTNTIDLTETADDQSSREASAGSNHDSLRFRYPSPDNTQPSIPGYTTTVAMGGDLSGLGPAGNTNTMLEGQAAQSSQAVPMAGLNPDGTAAPVIEEPASGTEKGKKKKKVIRRKKVQTAQEGDDGRATVDMQLNRPRRVAGAKRSRKKKDGEKKKRTRAMTPEGAEDEIIDRSVMTVGELCKDIRIGKKFSKHEKVKANLARDKEKAKLRQLGLLPAEEEEGEQANRNGERSSTSQPIEESEVPGGEINDNNPQFKLVDGVIVIDETSLQVDRQERGRAEIIEVEAVEEDDFTKPSTSGHHMKRERAQTWDYAGTELFYKGLRMFGTDFETIGKLFPHRSRRHIKLKFNKEERDWPQKIQKALSAEQRLDMDLVMFQQLSNLTLVGTDILKAEQNKIEQEHREEEERHLAEQAETIRMKREAIRVGQAAARRMLASVDDDDTHVAGTESAKENAEPARGTIGEASAALKSKKKAAAKKKKKNMHSSNAGGEEVEILGFAD